MNPDEAKLTFEFDREDYGNNIQCEYDYGNHPRLPVFQQCARCLHVKGKLTPLCTMCGYRKNGLKLCNDCFEETSQAHQVMQKIKEQVNG